MFRGSHWFYIMMKLRLYLLVIFSICASLTVFAEETDKQDAQAITPQQTKQARMDALKVLINRQQYEQAFVLASRMLEENEGLPDFDFLYGMAAVESGQYDQALFAFERLVLSFPNQPRYRLELARSHFYLKNLVRAEEEFNNVLKQNPPIPVKRNVQKFLDQIAKEKQTIQPKFLFALDIGGGYDSNINSATNEDFIPVEESSDLLLQIGNNQITSQETASSYWSALAHFLYIAPLTKTSSFDGRLITSTKSHSETPIYDLTTLMLEGGYSFYTGPIKWRGAGRYQNAILDGSDFSTTQLLTGQANWVLNSRANLGLGINYGMSSYSDNDNGDTTLQQFTLSYASAPNKDSWKLNLLFGTDSADKDSNKHNGRTFQGFTYQSNALLSETSSRYWMLNVLSTEYDAKNIFFEKLRKDQNLLLGIGWRHSITRSFTFRHDYSFSYNDSSLTINEYKKAKAEIGLTYSF